MRVIVCHSNWGLVQLARLHAERQGIEVDVARNAKEVLVRARKRRPNAIVLSPNLTNPSAQELKATIEFDPSLRGVKVAIVDGNVADLLKFRFPAAIR